jgi:hypothetical protein
VIGGEYGLGTAFTEEGFHAGGGNAKRHDRNEEVYGGA